MSSSGFPSLKESYRSDVVSGLLVFFIALPLCLGISLASGVPPVAGLLTAMVGGMLTVFLGSAPLTIKGPAAGLIVIVLGAVQELGEGDAMLGYKRALAVGLCAAIIQILLSIVKAGRLADFFPPSVVHGMLAAIGVTIFSRQIHALFGVIPSPGNALGLLSQIPESISNLNPEITAIGVTSLALMFIFPKLPFAWSKSIPAPIVVLALACILGIVFDLTHLHTYSFGHHAFKVGPNYLVKLPHNLLDAIAFPDFSAITSVTSIKYIIMFAFVGTIESLLSAQAVVMLDSKHRMHNPDKDLFATGVANAIAACIGGIPMISEIVRSSANIANGAKSKWSNFFHGFFLLVFVALFPTWLEHIPLAALAAMLVFTGLRLASPSEFTKTFRIGSDQLAVFLTTLIGTLAIDLLVGVLLGVTLKALLHIARGAPLNTLFTPHIETTIQHDTEIISVSGSATFLNYLRIKKYLESTQAKKVIVNFSNAKLIDHTVLEKLHHTQELWKNEGKTLEWHFAQEHHEVKHPLGSRLKKTV